MKPYKVEDLPAWMKEMAKELQGSWQRHETRAYDFSKEEILDDVVNELSSGYSQYVSGILSGVHINQDPKVKMPAELLEVYPSLPLEVPARVGSFLNRYLGVSTSNARDFAACIINNFSLNMSLRLVGRTYSELGHDYLLLPSERILSSPSITAKTFGDMWNDFDDTIERLGIKDDFLSTLTRDFIDTRHQDVRPLLLDKYGWYGSHTTSESNKAAFPAFIDMASRGWAIGPLCG